MTSPEHPSRAERLKQAAQARELGLAQAEHAADPRIILAIDTEIEKANASGQPWSANTIRDRLPVSHTALVGNRVRAAMMRRTNGRPEMVWINEEPSTLRSTHKKPIAVWLGFNAWASANPDAAAEYLSHSS
jgi:hypothetical protein